MASDLIQQGTYELIEIYIQQVRTLVQKVSIHHKTHKQTKNKQQNTKQQQKPTKQKIFQLLF